MEKIIKEWEIILNAIPEFSEKKLKSVFDAYRERGGRLGSKMFGRYFTQEYRGFPKWCAEQGYKVEVFKGEKEGRKNNQNYCCKIPIECSREVSTEGYKEIVTSTHFLQYLSSPILQKLGKPSIKHFVSHSPHPEDLNSWQPVRQDQVLQKALMHSGWGVCMYEDKHLKWLADFLEAINDRRFVTVSKVKYNSSEPATVPDPIRGIPLRLYYHRDTLYFCIYSEDLEQVLLYEVEGVKYLIVSRLDPRFSPEDSLSDKAIHSFFKTRFGVTAGKGVVEKIRLVWGFLPKEKLFVEWRRWHDGQVCIRNDEDCVELIFHAQINRELVGWIMMWLDHVKVLEPKSLADMIKEKAQSIAALYLENQKPKNYNHPNDY